MSGKMDSQRANRKILRRTLGLLVVFGIAAFVPLFVQLYDIQIKDHEHYEERAVNQQTRDVIVSANRGVIYDRNLNAMAVSASVETVYIAPKEIETEEAAAQIASGLSEILNVEYDTVYNKALKNNYYETIAKKIDKSLADRVRVFISDSGVKGIHIESDTKRYYPYGDLGSHIIGFVGSENQGLEGVEAIYDSSLSGTPGRIVSAKNAKGTNLPFTYEQYYDAQDGNSVVLTMDSTIQGIVEKQLLAAVAEYEVKNRAVGIVMNVNTGEVLAMAVVPEYDLNSPRTILDEETLLELAQLEGAEYTKKLGEAQQQMWRNKAVSDTYEPGSTFKIITSAIALEEGVAGLEDTFTCTGSINVAGWSQPIKCWRHPRSHGTQNFATALANSCNPAFITLGLRIGHDTFYDYMEAFGLLSKTNIDMAGESGSIVLPRSDFSKNQVNLAVYAFGQRFNITPIQMITAVSAAVNGGYLMEPYVVKEVVDANGNTVAATEPTVVRQVISESTSRSICEMLENVVDNGTAGNASVRGYRIGGKTGTSEKAGEAEGCYVVSFVGVAPADDPEIAVLVLLDEPMSNTYMRSGGIMAAPVVGSILAEVLPYMGFEAEYTADEFSGTDVYVPNVLGMDVETAAAALAKKNMEYTVVGSGTTVTGQIPAASAKVPCTAKVILYMEEPVNESMVRVPDIIGKTPEQVYNAITGAGLYLRATGSDTSTRSSSVQATKQSVEAGSMVKFGTVINVEFLDMSAADY